MSESLVTRLDRVVRQLEKSNWIESHQLVELKEILKKLRLLRELSVDGERYVKLLLKSVEVLPNGRVIVMHGQGFYSAIGKLKKMLDAEPV